MTTIVCNNEQRREQVRQHQELNGIDYVEVGADFKTLLVFFLGKAPVELDTENIRIEGGRRVRDVRVTDVQVHRFSQIEFDDYMEVFVDKAGDFSTYSLRIVEQNEEGEWQSHTGFDARYDRIDFNFKADCPSDLDCKKDLVCPPEPIEEPDIDYLAKDYASFRQLILDRLALLMPEWNERHVPDVGIALVEILAYVGDYLSYYQDAVATEAYLDTARKRVSVRRHARLVDYPMHEGCNARTWVCLVINNDLKLLKNDYFFTTSLNEVQPNSNVVLSDEELLLIPSDAYVVFEPMADDDIQLYRDHSRIRFYTWDNKECCIPRGATSATLIGVLVADIEVPQQDEPCEPEEDVPDQEPVLAKQHTTTTSPDTGYPELHLKAGDILLFEEVIGPETGHPGDADPTHRHVVRLTGVEAGFDQLHEQPVVEITWAEQDALPFPLCISSLGPAPDCEIIVDVSIACGNVVLVDHGQTVNEDLGSVPVGDAVECCRAEGVLAETLYSAGPYTPVLDSVPLTYSVPIDDGLPASEMLLQDVRQALPDISLNSNHVVAGKAEWEPKRDLLASDDEERHFVAETDNEGRARLRFGDGISGRTPQPNTGFEAEYRIGNGLTGNIGRDAVSHLVMRNTQLSGVTLTVRNPLPAQGGTAPEPINEVKLFAPHTFRKKLQRAIIAEDYAAIVEREFKDKVQRAAARLRWMGSWYEMLVAVDPYGEEEADKALLDEISGCLHRYRRIGHDLRVVPACRVPLDIEMVVCVSTDYLRGHVKAVLLDLFSNRILVGGQSGIFHVDKLSFGDDIYLSHLVATAQSVMGVESVQVTRMQRLNELPNHEIENGVLPLGPFEIARLDNDPSQVENGKLTLDMRGGR